MSDPVRWFTFIGKGDLLEPCESTGTMTLVIACQKVFPTEFRISLACHSDAVGLDVIARNVLFGLGSLRNGPLLGNANGNGE